MRVKITALIYVFLIGTSSLFAQRREAAPVEFKKISGRLYEIVGGRGARGGCYIGDNGVLLIDAKQDETSVNQVLTWIKNQTDQPVTYLVSTHSDGDHIWGNQYYPKTVTYNGRPVNSKKNNKIRRDNGTRTSCLKKNRETLILS